MDSVDFHHSITCALPGALIRKQREWFALFGMTPMKGTSNN